MTDDQFERLVALLEDIKEELSEINSRVDATNSELSTISTNTSPVYDNGDICKRLDKIANLLEE